MFQVGDEIRIKSSWLRVYPESPIVGVKLRIAQPDHWTAKNEITVIYQGQRYYVNKEFVEPVTTPQP